MRRGNGIGETQAALLASIRRDGAATVRELADRSGVALVHVDRAVRALVERGCIRPVAIRGRARVWALTWRGVAVLRAFEDGERIAPYPDDETELELVMGAR